MKREHVKQTAIVMATEKGLGNLSRRDLCKRAGIPDGSFPYIMGCNFSDLVQELEREGHGGGVHPLTKKRADPAARQQHILRAAVDMSREVGYTNITRDGVAERAGVSMGLVTRYFGTMKNLRRAIMGYALSEGESEIIRQGLLNQDPRAMKAPQSLRDAALATCK